MDRLQGLKENVIIGKLIPAGSGLAQYRQEDVIDDEGNLVAQARRRPDRDVDFNSEDDEDEETNGEPGDEPALDDLLADAEFGALSLEPKA